MATRIYLPSAGSPFLTPAQTNGWDASISTGLQVLPAGTTKSDTAMATAAHSDTNPNDQDICFRQFVVTEPLGAQTIAAQTVKLQIRGLESNSLNNMFVALMIYTVGADGVIKSALFSTVQRDNLELAGSLTNRSFSATTTSVDTDSGDYLVIEVGTGGDPTATFHNSSLRFGDPSGGSDLAEDDSTTTDDVPWLEFADTLTLGVSDATVTSITSAATSAAALPVPKLSINPAASTAIAAAGVPIRSGFKIITSVAAQASAGAGVPTQTGGPPVSVNSVAATATAAAGEPFIETPSPGEDFIVPGPEPVIVYVNTEKACYAQFLDADGAFVDPDTVTFRTRAPNGEVQEYVYGDHNAVLKDALGVYHCRVTFDQVGPWTVAAKGEDPDVVEQREKIPVLRSIM